MSNVGNPSRMLCAVEAVMAKVSCAYMTTCSLLLSYVVLFCFNHIRTTSKNTMTFTQFQIFLLTINVVKVLAVEIDVEPLNANVASPPNIIQQARSVSAYEEVDLAAPLPINVLKLKPITADVPADRGFYGSDYPKKVVVKTTSWKTNLGDSCAGK